MASCAPDAPPPPCKRFSVASVDGRPSPHCRQCHTAIVSSRRIRHSTTCANYGCESVGGVGTVTFFCSVGDRKGQKQRKAILSVLISRVLRKN